MPRSLGLLDRLQPLLLIGAIGLGLGLAAGAPDLARRAGWMVSAGVFLVIYLIMLGVRERDLLAAFRRLKPTSIALAVNFLLTPLVAWGLGFLFLKDQPEVWVGLILYLVTPCIGWYLVFTDLADGDVELGISLLFWNILLQVSLLPVYMWALAGRIVPIDLGAILESVVLFLALPYALAFATRRLLTAGGRDAAALPGLGLGKTASLMAVIAAMFASQGEVLLENPGLVWRMVAPGAVFFAFAFALALLLGRLARLTYREVALLTFTTTARNSEVSLALAATAFASPLVALTVVIGPAIELPVLILILRALQAIRSRGWYS
jgi:ACR3 family arsenite transporter